MPRMTEDGLASSSRDDSPVRGKMTITLTSAVGGEKDETAKVKIEVNNPELVAERVVSHLARKFPPESVMTIATIPHNDLTGIASCSSSSEDASATQDTSGCLDKSRIARARTSESSDLSHTSSCSHRVHRLLREEVKNSQSGRDSTFGSSSNWNTHQHYFISDDLDMAVPVARHQGRIRLYDRSSMSVSPDEVFTVHHNETGHAFGVTRGFESANQDCKLPLPQKRGIGTFAQDYLIHDELERAVPLCPGQRVVQLIDGSSVPIRPEQVCTVKYGSKGLAQFYRLHNGTVAPGTPPKPGIAFAAVHHQVTGDTAVPLSSSPTAKGGHRSKRHVVLFDSVGEPICVRGPSGGLTPGGLPNKGSASSVEYFYTPSDCSKAIRIASLGDQRARLITGASVSALPDDISIILKGADGSDLGGFVNNRRPSYVQGTRADVLPVPGINFSKLDRGQREANNKSAHLNGNQSKKKENKSSPSAKESQSFGSSKKGRSQEIPKSQKAALRPSAEWMLASTDSVDDTTSDGQASFSSGGAGHRFLKRNPKMEGYCRTQLYFFPNDIQYAIPIFPDQAEVKLADGKCMSINRSQITSVDYDQRGFPIRTNHPDGRSTPWIVKIAGMGAKFQDYLTHPDLLYAVPIVPNQTEVVISDGTRIAVPPSNILTVFYDAAGKPAFSLSAGKRRIRPGLRPKDGVASSVQYLMLVDANDDTGEQFVIPFKAHQREVPDPSRPKHMLKIDRKAITVAFFDQDRQPLYTQLADGSLVGGGLLGSRQSTESSSYCASNSSATEGDNNFPLRLEYSEQVRRVSIGSTSVPPMKAKELKENVARRGMNDSVPATTRRQEIIERRVPVQQIEYIDRTVEVPETHYIDKHVEVERIEWKTTIVKKKQIVERPVEHVKYVPKVEIKLVERIIEVPQIIEVPRPEIIEQKVKVDKFIDMKANVSVAQTIRPVVRDSLEIFEDVECLTLEPEMIPVDVFVPRLVRSKLVAVGVIGQAVKEVEVQLAHYNSLVLKMNPRFANNYEKLPMIKTASGCFPLLPSDQQITVVTPTADEITGALIAAGVVSKKATPEEITKLRQQPDENRLAEDEFAPKTCAIRLQVA